MATQSESTKRIDERKLARPTIPQYPAKKKQDPFIKGNRFAGPYQSVFTEQSQTPTLSLLEHVNCSYLSSPNDTTVTLLELKQHAQSLTNLIRHLGLSTSLGVINKGATGDQTDGNFVESEVFDWLNNLEKPYKNEDESHNITLTTLLNQLSNGLEPATEKEQDLKQEKCPLQSVKKPSDAHRQYMYPLATNEALAKHANEILERLDHEYGSAGGILGMLPVNEREDEKVKETAQNTFLGQWIAFTRALVLRCHELEQGYAAALDVLAGEAVVPGEILKEIDAIGRKPKPLSRQQDHFVICNTENKMWPKLELELSKRESKSNDAITWVSIPTRYYRLRDSTTVFVVPSFDNSETWEIASNPTVVQVVKPKWGDHASAWEEKLKVEMIHLQSTETDLSLLRSDYKRSLDDILVLKSQKERWDAERRIFNAAEYDSEQKKWMEKANSESKRLVLEAKQLEEMGKDLVKRTIAVEKREKEVEDWFKEMADTWRTVTGQNPSSYV